MPYHYQRRLMTVMVLSFILLSIPSPAPSGARSSGRASPDPLIQQSSSPPQSLLDPAATRRAIALAHLARKRAVLSAARQRRIEARELARVRYLGGADWFAIARCESGMRWSLNVGAFDGGLQFLPSTWIRAGGRRFARTAWQAAPAEQVIVAAHLLAVSGPSQWPYCFRHA